MFSYLKAILELRGGAATGYGSACGKIHFRKVIKPWTDESLGASLASVSVFSEVGGLFLPGHMQGDQRIELRIELLFDSNKRLRQAHREV